jgi:beta-galactosidase/beta-glucuronidase
MKISIWLGVCIAFCAGVVDGASNEYQMANGPLKTRWARNVSPRNVWPEYPRPQMVRKKWLNLNGLWDYTILSTNQAAPTSYTGKILVPFPIESALSGVMGKLDEKSHLVYHRSFELPGSWNGERILLHFGACDWATTVFVNDIPLTTHFGGYDPFTYEITSALKPGRTQELRVDVYDPTEGGQARGKQVRQPNGIWYTSTSGIWQTVWVEPVPVSSIQDLVLTPDIDAKTLRITTQVRGPREHEMVDAVAYDGSHEAGHVTGPAGAQLQIPIANPKLWSPDHPFLYDLKVMLREGRETLDTVRSYFGMRKISLGKDSKGNMHPMLNGQAIFQIGTLDQGFWPDGIYTPPTDAAMRYDLEVTKKLGFNMVRKHVKVEPDRWYYDCDKLGLVVWQDMPGAYLGNRTEADKKWFEHELRRMVATHYNHPCIIQWVLFNEGWGQFDTVRLTGVLKQIDPTRLVDDASGWTDRKVGDIVDKHHYPAPVKPELETNRASVQGEFGGLGLFVDGHTWAKKSWGYQGMADGKALTARYVELMNDVLNLETNAGLTAAVYTQTTDVETECNGLMTYDRELIKPDVAAVSAANRKLQSSSP